MTYQPIDWGTVEAALYSWLSGIVPNVIFEDQRIPSPSYPYCSVLLLASSRKGGKDNQIITTDLTRAKNILVTPTVQDLTLYSINIGANTANYTSGIHATAAQITAGLAAQMARWPQTVVDNVGTLTVSASSVFNILVTANLSWANNDFGHENVATTTGTRKVTYQLTFHNNEANMRAATTEAGSVSGMAFAEAAVSSLSQQATIDLLWGAGIGIVAEQGAHKMDMVINGEWVSRGIVDIQFNIGTLTTGDNGYIATAPAGGTVDGTPLS